jgi:hypothetical protein
VGCKILSTLFFPEYYIGLEHIFLHILFLGLTIQNPLNPTAIRIDHDNSEERNITAREGMFLQYYEGAYLNKLVKKIYLKIFIAKDFRYP